MPDILTHLYSLDDAMVQYEEEQKMRYVTSFERIGIKKGRQEGLQQGRTLGRLESAREDIIDILNARFEIVPPSLESSINAIEGLSLLKHLLKKAATVESLDAFQKTLRDVNNIQALDKQESGLPE